MADKLSNTLSDHIATQVISDDFNAPAFSFSAGTAGTYATVATVSTAKTGYKTVSVTPIAVNHPSAYFIVPQINSDNTVNIIVYRIVTTAANYTAGEIKIRCTYIKT